MSTPNSKYLEASINSAPPEELNLRVFDALVMFSKQAVAAIRETPEDIQRRHDLLRRSQSACALLMGSLDFEVGGELARNLFRVYEFWHHDLVMANMYGDPERVERLIPDFISYRETWGEAIRRFRLENVNRREREPLELVGS